MDTQDCGQASGSTVGGWTRVPSVVDTDYRRLHFVPTHKTVWISDAKDSLHASRGASAGAAGEAAPAGGDAGSGTGGTVYEVGDMYVHLHMSGYDEPIA